MVSPPDSRPSEGPFFIIGTVIFMPGVVGMVPSSHAAIRLSLSRTLSSVWEQRFCFDTFQQLDWFLYPNHDPSSSTGKKKQIGSTTTRDFLDGRCHNHSH